MSATPSSGGNPTRKLALVVGIDDYRRPENKLRTCCQNADRLSHVLQGMGFEVSKHKNVKTRTEMVGHVQEWSERIQEDDLILFYFSGHGCQVDGKNYLLLSENDFRNEGEVEDEAMPVSHVIGRILEKNKTNATISILDCCRTYRFQDGSRTGGLERMVPSEQSFIQFACGEGQTTAVNSFSEHLIRNIGRSMEIRLLFEKIGNDVRRESDRRQMPLSMYNIRTPIYLRELVEDLPDIPLNARWKRRATTTMGGIGPGLMPGRLHNPRGVWVRKNKGILVVDSAHHRVLEYGRDKQTRKVAGSRVNGFGFSQLSSPTDVIFDETTQTFLICDARNRRVSRWSRGRKICDGIVVDRIACYGIAMDCDGNIYVSDTERHAVRRYAPGDRHGVIVAGGNGRGSRLNQLSHPTYICIGPRKSLYISDSDNNRVVRWDPDDEQGVVVAGGRGRGRDLSQLDYPTGIVVDRKGTLYVADHWNSRIMRWYSGRTRGERIAGELRPGESPSQMNGPQGLRFDQKGNLYVVDGYNHRLQRFEIREAQ